MDKLVKKPNEISSSFRTERPGNYLFKIESFSVLLQALTKTKRDKYDSRHFAAQGYKWKLSLYPNGYKKRDGDGYISLYLALAEPNSLPLGEEVHVILKFFVFDHCQDGYLVLQDGKYRRFHALRTEWGLERLLPLKTFKDPSKGYLVDDCCAFGVEIFFHKHEWKKNSLSMIKDSDAYTWKIVNFSFNVSQYSSTYSSAGGCQWMVRLQHEDAASMNGKSLSLSLHLKDLSFVSLGKRIYTELNLSIKDQVNGKNQERTASHWFSTASVSFCHSDFVLMSDLKDESTGFVVKDSVIIEVKIMVVSDVK